MRAKIRSDNAFKHVQFTEIVYPSCWVDARIPDDAIAQPRCAAVKHRPSTSSCKAAALDYDTIQAQLAAGRDVKNAKSPSGRTSLNDSWRIVRRSLYANRTDDRWQPIWPIGFVVYCRKHVTSRFKINDMLSRHSVRRVLAAMRHVALPEAQLKTAEWTIRPR
jgi:hypothetical protein